MDNLFPKLPIADWIDVLIEWLVEHFEPFFEGIATGLEFFVDGIVLGLGYIPVIILALLVSLLAWKVCNWKIALFTIIGLLLIDNLGYWENMLDTIALVITSVGISILLGVPIGIWASQSEKVGKVVTPILDFMQTMPAFVYLLPAIFFFNIGVVPGVVASVIFAMPPTIRLTILGIKQVPDDLIEATQAFGSTTGQKLLKVQLPLALPTIMAGINQSIMLALSMVVIASMVGAPGLGADVYRAVTQLQTGTGFEAGLAIVIIAIILDRITQNIGKTKRGGNV
ncbi:ABC transporter permease [Metabacillus niabensis]|uniref:Glycine betaine/proline transport system permease protein n=1 Tax=Metabacillus niabensis TaxID=324854 RepID=A0ABT9Z6R4_9BACI|nr:proline/glycine betaine ABC transporter permease [Metabacillus niabensis]MDQ0227949.1 glycine betaine/proline transport system permease protein [Metabacillus niabensis]